MPHATAAKARISGLIGNFGDRIALGCIGCRGGQIDASGIDRRFYRQGRRIGEVDFPRMASRFASG
jgi:hypothetical protein